jgi:hypothetical protein
MALAALGNGIIDTIFFEDHGIQLAYALTCAVCLSLLTFLWLPRMLAQVPFLFIYCSFFPPSSASEFEPLECSAFFFWFAGYRAKG